LLLFIIVYIRAMASQNAPPLLSVPAGPRLSQTKDVAGLHRDALCCSPWRDKANLVVPEGGISSGFDMPDHTELLNQILTLLPTMVDQITGEVRSSQHRTEERIQVMLQAMESRLEQQQQLLEQNRQLLDTRLTSNGSSDGDGRDELTKVLTQVFCSHMGGDEVGKDGNTEKDGEVKNDLCPPCPSSPSKISKHSTGDGIPMDTRQSGKSLRHQFMAVFNELDLQKDGYIEQSELRYYFERLGLPSAQSNKLFASFDDNGDGRIDRSEWLTVIHHFEEKQDCPEHHAFLAALIDRYQEFGYLYEREKASRCIIHHDSYGRVAWDMLTLFLLFYIGLTLPLMFAFGDECDLRVPDAIVDLLFIVDVLLNFRTTYLNANAERVSQGKAIARHYLKTWFILDFLSSIPFDHMTSGLIPGMQSLKMMKVGKLGKVLKLLRLSKLLKVAEGSEIIEDLEEIVWSTHCGKFIHLGYLMVLLVVCGHWLACLLLSLNGQSLEAYLLTSSGQPTDIPSQYLAALYWAIMTISTVGYGDISMRDNSERLLAIMAMICGGSLYAYLVGSITALVADNDLNSRAFKERMNLVMAWLDFHDELPAALRRRIWRHFKEHLAKKTAVEDSIVMNDLPSNLKHTLSSFLLQDDIRYNPLFDGLPTHELPQLVLLVQHSARAPDETICFRGERGHAMFVLHKGDARRIDVIDDEFVSSQVASGESFGEEILLGICLEYTYTVVAGSKCALLKIPADDFAERFSSRPDLLLRMRENFDKTVGCGGRSLRSGHCGSSSVLEGGCSGVSPSFPDAVFSTLNELLSKVDMLHDRHKEGIMGMLRPATGLFQGK
jgi:hypothetical protein